MGNCVTDWVFRRQKFCCCLPVRLGVAVLSFLSILLVGLLMIIIWFEVHTNYFMSNKEKIAFVVAGLVETFLFLASILGFIGTCARKQSFVVIYATFLYIHFFINLAVAIYFLWEVTHAANTDIVKLCQEGIRNDQAKGQCTGLLNIAKSVYWGVSLVILSIEAYCALVVTRYVNQLRYEKRDVRRSRMLQRQSAYDAFHSRFASTVSAGGADADKEGQGLLSPPHARREFDPYIAHAEAAARSPVTPTVKSVREFAEVPEVHGYGVGMGAVGYGDMRKGEDIEMGRMVDSEPEGDYSVKGTRTDPDLEEVPLTARPLLSSPHGHERDESRDSVSMHTRPLSFARPNPGPHPSSPPPSYTS